MSEAAKDQQLTLKVMRLTKPNFSVNPSFHVDSGDVSAVEFQRCDAELSVAHPVACSSMLMLPQSFENIYLGETFTCYVCIHNDSSQTTTEVSLKVDLQTSSQRVSLPNKFQEVQAELKPDQTLGEIISHEVKEIGQHILVCAVSYTSSNGEKMYFRKFFKFPTKFYNAENDDVYLEAQIQNTTHMPMVMEKVALEASELYVGSELNVKSDPADDETLFAGHTYMNPNDIRQYLYCLRPRTNLGVNYKGITSIGKLDLVWRTAMGERGRLQTSQLQRMAPGYGDLKLTVIESPSTVKVGEAFHVRCKIQNNSERTLDLLLVLEGGVNPTLLWCSKSNRQLGKLDANCSSELNFCIVPVAAGLQTISGVRITDSFLNRTYEFDEIGQVFVY